MPVIDPSAVDRLLRIGGARLARQMIELFLQHGPERIALAESGLAAGDIRQIEMSAHSLKSSAGNVGAVHLQRSATELEAFVHETDPAIESLTRLVLDMRACYDAAAQHLTERLTEISA